MSMLLYLFILYFCGIWAFSSGRNHLLVTLLNLEFVVLVLYLSVCFCLVGLIVVCSLLFIFLFFRSVSVRWVCLF